MPDKVHGNKGKKLSEETKRKLSEALKGRKMPERTEETRRKMSAWVRTEETRRKIREAAKGRKHTEESKRKMSEAKKGRKLSEETRRKMSGRTPWNKDKTGVYSEETRRKIREARKRQIFSEETKRKISEAGKGRKASDETKRKMSAWVRTEETRRKMSEAKKGNKNMLGKTHSEESKRKIGEANKGKKHTEEQNRKNGERKKGKKLSEETKRKMSDAQNRPEVKRKNIEFHNRPEQKERQSKKRAKQKFPQKDTQPEIILQGICNDEGIEFVTQKTIKLQHYDWHHVRRHQVDLFIEPKICLFADGDYWHANPNPYMYKGRLRAGIKPDTVLVASSKEKKKTGKYVREKDAGITLDLEEQGYTVIRFWESDLLHDKEKCRQQIVDVVRKSKESLA